MERKKVLVFYIYTILFCFMPMFSEQNNIIITENQCMQDGDTLDSAGGTFEAGFFSFENSQRQYFGIWYKAISPRTIVWVANRDTPIENSTPILNFTSQGNFLIHDGSKGIIWSSNTSRIARKPFMQLLDSGNLVVKDGDKGEKENLLWESFDYPGDTLLAGMKIKSNLVTGQYRSLTSWRNTQDPASGEFSYHIDTCGFPQLVVTKGKNVMFRAGPWIGNYFSGVSLLRVEKFLKFSLLFSDNELSYGYENLNRSIVTRAVLNPSGTTQRLIWSDESQSWEIVSTHPSDQCEYYAFCGANSKCDVANYPICECLEGFHPKFQEKWSSLDWTGGCVKIKNLNCENEHSFLKYTKMKLPDTSSSWFGKNKTLDECETLCLQNCSCTAYAYLDDIVGGSGCLIWIGHILDLRKHSDQGQDIYIRVAASELDHSKNKKNFNTKKLAGMLAGIVTFLICITILGLVLPTCIQWKKNERPGDYVTRIIHKDNRRNEDIDLATIFDFSVLSNATNNFSQNNKLGEGGFGPVYKGLLADGQEIAVKRLSNTSGQGTEEFKNEVMLMARLQHRNLVKLLGCSIHQDEKLLVYEFMHNRSLDYFIFDSMRSKLIDWNKRFQIIDGIARGILYLHEDSRLRIIHRDLKTSNILLDNEMNPKISDFGLARTVIGDQVEDKTKRVMGTYGYMSPEYAVHGSFSIKSDVYSFGVIILEIISGRKIRGFHDPLHHLNLLSHAWRLWIEGRPLELTKELLDDLVTPSKMLRYIHVGLLCVQQRPENRPNMLSVVLMLNGEKALPKPSQPAFYTGNDNPTWTESHSKNCDSCSINEVSISLIEAR